MSSHSITPTKVHLRKYSPSGLHFDAYILINSNVNFIDSYIGSDKAIADLPWGSGNVASGGVGTFPENWKKNE